MSLWDVTVSIFWFMVLVAWIWLFIAILGDLFSDQETSGWAKAAWTLFMVVVPWLGCLTYLIFRGRSMNERSRQRALRQEQELRRYVQDVAAAPKTDSMASELTKLVDLRDRGAISAEEYDRAKAQVLGATVPAPRAARETVRPS
ncbi:MAG TPA: PLDc N-terminal domain-containing protein [Actinomycetales bacterium]|nr:PLDc N-terminal domain-containing protein [Actinomycetales bacterium]